MRKRLYSWPCTQCGEPYTATKETNTGYCVYCVPVKPEDAQERIDKMQITSGLMLSESGGGNFQPCPAGNHIARCFRLVDIGTHESEFNGQKKNRRLIRVFWELPGQLTDEGQPFTISQKYTHSLHEKSVLRQHLESWRGRPFTSDELKGFHLVNVLDKSCLVNVIHEVSKTGKTYANVASVTPFPKGMAAPDPVNPCAYLDLGEFDPQVFDSLPAWVQSDVKASQEWPFLAGLVPAASDVSSAADSEDIPF